MRRLVVVLSVLLVVSLPSASAHSGDAHGEMQDQSLSATGVLPPGDFAELDFEAAAGASLTYVVDAKVPVNVNIHEHQMGTVTHAWHNQTRSVSETFVVPHNGTFSLMIINPDDGTEGGIEVVFSGAFALVGSVGLSFDEDSPGPALALLLVGALLLAAGRRRFA